MKVIQIGPVSYVGGVSIHIKRLVNLLGVDKDFSLSIIDDSPKYYTPDGILNVREISNYKAITEVLCNCDLVHIHSGNWLLRIYVLILSTLFKCKVIVTLHSYRLSKFQNFVTSLFLTKVQRIISVNAEIKKKLPKRLHRKIVVKEAFLPPEVEGEPELPDEILALIKKYKNESIILCANAFRLKKYQGGELYGLDQCIKVARLAKSQNYNLHIIFVIGTIKDDDHDYYQSFVKEISDSNLNEFITIVPKSLSFIRLILECDLVLRPTLTDGDALTVREALYFGKGIIASDVVERPKGTKLYKTGDAISLSSTIKELDPINELENHLSRSVENNYKQFYINLYKECCN